MTDEKRKRIFAGGDFHCGSVVGLTPPEWQSHIYPAMEHKRRKQAETQHELWDIYSGMIQHYGPFDVAIINGDAVDGKGLRSGGTELITTDRNEQAKMAGRCITEIGAPKVLMTYGTPYHTGVSEDWEDVVAALVDAERIESHGYYDINGCIISARHKIVSSSVPYGRFTQLAKQYEWSCRWAAREQMRLPNIILRSHVHYFSHAEEAGWEGWTLPALQGLGSKFGSRQCDGTVDFGFLVIDIWEDGSWHGTPALAIGETQKSEPFKLYD